MTPSSANGLGNDGFLFLVATLCIAGVLLFLAVRWALIHLKDREVKRTGVILLAEREDLERRANELEALQAEIELHKANLTDLAAQKLVLTRRGRKRTTASRRFIHEIGRGEPGRSLFTFTLSMVPGFAQRPGAKSVVHPSIWAFQNEAKVWAADFPAAQMLTRTVFNDAVGVSIGVPGGGDAEEGAEEGASPAAPPANAPGAMAS